MYRFALLILLASSFPIATFSSLDSPSLDTFDSSLWSPIGKTELSSSGPVDSVPRRPEDDGLVPLSGSGDMMTSYQEQEFITEDAGQGLAGNVDLCNQPVTATTVDENSQSQSDSDAGGSCGPMTDSQTPSTPASSWSAPNPDPVQKRDQPLFCPAPSTVIGKKKLRPKELIEPNISRGEPDDSRNYGGPNVRLRVPGGEENDKRRCASQKRTLCCKGPANLPRIVRNCWHYDPSNEVCEDYRSIYCCRRTDFRYRSRMLNRIPGTAGLGYVCTYLFQIYNPPTQGDP